MYTILPDKLVAALIRPLLDALGVRGPNKGTNMSETQTSNPEVAPAPEGTPRGAHHHGDGRVTFALWAPWKKSVHVIGDFNGWDKTADPLAVDDTGLWWIEKQLEPGEYGYQFVIDGETVVGDPYGKRLTWAGGNIPNAIIRIGAEEYQWNDGSFGIKPMNQLVIYELHVGDFSPEGNFKGVTDRLDYLADLGVDAIELMPVQEFPGDHSWGYNPAYFFAVEGSYGTVEDFKHLVDAAHQRGIGVILDMVFNHTTADSPINMLYSYDENPYLGGDGNPWGFPDFNHWNDATKQFIADVQSYWLSEFHIDGFRYDYVEGIRYDGVGGMSFISWSARQNKPYAYLIAEDIRADPAAVVRDTECNASWHWQFTKVLRAQLREGPYEGNQYGDMDAIISVMTHNGNGYGDNAEPINYLESHDEERLMREVMSNPNTGGELGAIRKSMLGAVALFTAQGVPMLYAGQEFGATAEKTIDVSKLPWEHLERGEYQALRNHYASMAYMRHTVGALNTNNFQVLLADHDKRVLVFHRWNDEGSVVVVALNFSPTDQTVTFPFPQAGVWHEWLHDYDEHVGEEPFTATIDDSFAKVWVLQG